MPAVPVVFIPALLCDGMLYQQVIARLDGRIEPQVAISPRPSLEESAAEILALAPPRFVLVGSSYGANLALEVALAAPERVEALWLMGVDPSPAPPGGPDLAGGLEAAPEAVIDLLAGLVVRPQAAEAAAVFRDMAHRLGAAAGAAQARAVAARRETASRLARLDMPALLVWGEDDPIAPVAVGRALAEALPDARFHALAECGHLPALERPAESAALFAAFLDELAGRGG